MQILIIVTSGFSFRSNAISCVKKTHSTRIEENNSYATPLLAIEDGWKLSSARRFEPGLNKELSIQIEEKCAEFFAEEAKVKKSISESLSRAIAEGNTDQDIVKLPDYFRGMEHAFAQSSQMVGHILFQMTRGLSCQFRWVFTKD